MARVVSLGKAFHFLDIPTEVKHVNVRVLSNDHVIIVVNKGAAMDKRQNLVTIKLSQTNISKSGPLVDINI